MLATLSQSAYGRVTVNAAGLLVLSNARSDNDDARPRASGWQTRPREWEHTRWQKSAFGHRRQKSRPDPTLTYGNGPACPLPTATENRQAYLDSRKSVKATKKRKLDMRPNHAKGLPCVCKVCKVTVRATGTVEHATKDHL